jgi:hypothetical protein
MSDSRSVTDGLSEVSLQQSQRPQADDHAAHSATPPRTRSWCSAGVQPCRRCFCNGRVRNGLTWENVSVDLSNPG